MATPEPRRTIPIIVLLVAVVLLLPARAPRDASAQSRPSINQNKLEIAKRALSRRPVLIAANTGLLTDGDVPNGTTTITAQFEPVDTHGAFTPSTGEFRVPEGWDGFYLCTANIRALPETWVQNSSWQLVVQRNGVTVAGSTRKVLESGFTPELGRSVSALVYATAEQRISFAIVSATPAPSTGLENSNTIQFHIVWSGN